MHNGSNDEEWMTKSVLIRFRLTNGDLPSIDDASITTWHVAHSRKAGSRGLMLLPNRSPSERSRACRSANTSRKVHRYIVSFISGSGEPKEKIHVFMADITAAPSPDADLQLSGLLVHRRTVKAKSSSSSTSLEDAPATGGFLVVTASEDAANAFHGNTLWFVADGETTCVKKIATFEVAMKAEGLTILGAEKQGPRTAVKLLIAYDNDADATYIPSRVQQAMLVRQVH